MTVAGSASRPGMAVVLMSQAYAAWLLSGLRSFGRAGISWAVYAPLLVQQLGAIALGQRSNAIRLLLDESAAQLRDLGDLSVQEALALRKLLLELAAQLRQLDGETLDEPRRYAKTKP